MKEDRPNDLTLERAESGWASSEIIMHKRILLRLLLAFLIATVPVVGADLGMFFIKEHGTFSMSLRDQITVSKSKIRGQQQFQVSIEGSNPKQIFEISTEHDDDPYLLYWDAGNRTVWWGTGKSIGYVRFGENTTTSSMSCYRKAFPKDARIPQPPKVFLDGLDQVLSEIRPM